MNVLLPLLCMVAILPTACVNERKAPAESGWTVSETDGITAFELGTTRRTSRMGDIVFAGQPGEGDIQTAADLGIKTVINLRPLNELTGWDEEKTVKDAGMTFIRIPFGNAEELTDSVYDRTRKHLKSADRPVLIHCASANRVGGVWIPYRVLDEGAPLEQAVSEAKEIGMRTKDYGILAKEYIKKNR